MGLINTIALVTMSTLRSGAGAAGVPWVHQLDRDTCQCGLVRDQRPQLSKGPIAVSRPLLGATNPRPLTHAGQFLQLDRPRCVFGLSNQLLGNPVVFVGLKAALTT